MFKIAQNFPVIVKQPFITNIKKVTNQGSIYFCSKVKLSENYDEPQSQSETETKSSTKQLKAGKNTEENTTPAVIYLTEKASGLLDDCDKVDHAIAKPIPDSQHTDPYMPNNKPASESIASSIKIDSGVERTELFNNDEKHTPKAALNKEADKGIWNIYQSMVPTASQIPVQKKIEQIAPMQQKHFQIVHSKGSPTSCIQITIDKTSRPIHFNPKPKQETPKTETLKAYTHAKIMQLDSPPQVSQPPPTKDARYDTANPQMIELEPYKTELVSSDIIRTKNVEKKVMQALMSKQLHERLLNKLVPPPKTEQKVKTFTLRQNRQMLPKIKKVVFFGNMPAKKAVVPIPKVKQRHPVRMLSVPFKGKSITPISTNLSLSNTVTQTLRENRLLNPVTGEGFIQKYSADPLLNPHVWQAEKGDTSILNMDVSKEDANKSNFKSFPVLVSAPSKLVPKNDDQVPETKPPSPVPYEMSTTQTLFHNRSLGLNKKSTKEKFSLPAQNILFDKKEMVPQMMGKSKPSATTLSEPKEPSRPEPKPATPLQAPLPPPAASNEQQPPATGIKFQIPGKLLVAFTCKKCNTRNSKQITKHAYTKGVVIIRCDGCNNNHLIADNLKWFTDMGKKRNIEDIMAEKGEKVRKIDLPGGISEYLVGTES